MKKGAILVLILLALIVSVVLIFNFHGINGFTVKGISKCSDSDDGNEPFIKGIVQYKPLFWTKTYEDKCVSKIQLREYYCDGSKEKSKIYKCAGGCKDGACVKNQSQPTNDFCKPFVNNNLAENRINLLFLGFGYNNSEGISAVDKLKIMINYSLDYDGDNHGLFSVEPFKSNKDKFNVWYINEVYSREVCGNTEADFNICQDTKNLTRSCAFNNSYVIYMIDSKSYTPSYGGNPIGLAAPWHEKLETCSNKEGFCIKGDITSRAFVHEFGHSFGELSDEYVVGNNQNLASGLGGKNCYNGYKNGTTTICKDGGECFEQENIVYHRTIEECLMYAPWKDMIGNGCGQDGVGDCSSDSPDYNLEIGCFEGCRYDGIGIFRPTRYSIMYDPLVDPFSFGLWNEEVIRKKLVNLTN